MANVFDVAKYILHSIGGDISTMKLQKLCYYAQAWHLVWHDNKPLFSEDFEAWVNGPVCKELFHCHQGKFIISENDLLGDELTGSLTDEEISTIDKIIDFYGSKTGAWLSELTHKEKPWLEARGNISTQSISHNIISKKSMYDYYRSL